MNLKQLGRRIRSARKEQGLTLKSLESETGVSHSQISRIERGQNALVSSNVRKICDYLHIQERGQDAEPISGDVELKMRSLIQEWPQSAQMICEILDSIRQAYLGRSADEGGERKPISKSHRNQ